MKSFVHPGAEHPNAPVRWDGLAERFAVKPQTFYRWIDEGLPVAANGEADPFAAVNWISWHRLNECPVLRRAWRGYLTVFAGFLSGNHQPRHVRWLREQCVYTPTPTATWSALVPRPWQGAQQTILRDDGLNNSAIPAGTYWRIAGEGQPQWHGEVELMLYAQEPTTIAKELVKELLDEVEALAADFTYVYVHHQPTETLTEPLPARALTGSCLDAARLLTHRLRQRGHDARVVPGLIAHPTFANPHFWVEVHQGTQIIPLDPSLPAIARMLGADWRAVANAYSGGCDNRRVRFMQQALPDEPVNAAIGQFHATLSDGNAQLVNLWPGLDWVCGECSDTFLDVVY